MRFSVVIPTLNESSTIEHTLQRASQLAPYELIVADGGSRDGTRDLARPYASVVNGRRGRGTQSNAGAAYATGDVLVFLHADVRLPPGAFAAIERALRDPNVVGGYFRVRFGRRPHDVFLGAFYDLLRRTGIVYGDATVFARREVFLRLGGYRDYPIMEDVNLVSRLRGLGRMVQLPQAVIASTRRWRHGGLWRTWASWFAVQSLYGLHVSPHWLGRLYRAVR
jgi:rSAM/selenodomain-associated transferase 2